MLHFGHVSWPEGIPGKKHHIINRTEQNRIYFNKLVQGTSFEIQSIHA